jgi:hypothetical protein
MNSTYFYNKSDEDAKFLPIVDFSSYKSAIPIYSLQSDFDVLSTKVNNINITGTTIEVNSSVWLWIISVLAFVLGLFLLIMSLRNY